jgi:hypothetical protein
MPNPSELPVFRPTKLSTTVSDASSISPKVKKFALPIVSAYSRIAFPKVSMMSGRMKLDSVDAKGIEVESRDHVLVGANQNGDHWDRAIETSNRLLPGDGGVVFVHELPVTVREVAVDESIGRRDVREHLAAAAKELLTLEVGWPDRVVRAQRRWGRQNVLPVTSRGAETVEPLNGRLAAQRPVHDARVLHDLLHRALVDVVKDASRMVENDVEDDVDPASVRLIHQGAELGLGCGQSAVRRKPGVEV